MTGPKHLHDVPATEARSILEAYRHAMGAVDRHRVHECRRISVHPVVSITMRIRVTKRHEGDPTSYDPHVIDVPIRRCPRCGWLDPASALSAMEVVALPEDYLGGDPVMDAIRKDVEREETTGAAS